MVNNTNDADALDEVWFVLSKAFLSSKNDEIRTSLKSSLFFFLTFQNRRLVDSKQWSALPQLVYSFLHAKTEGYDYCEGWFGD